MKKPTTPAAGEAAQLPALSPEVKTKIAEWNQIREWMAKGKAREMELRRELVSLFVPNPKEGTNHVQGQGFAVTIGHKVSRELDEAALDAVMPQLPEHLRVVGTLISYRPKFDLKVYRSMSDDERKIFDQALTIKEGAPELEIIVSDAPPAEASPADVDKARADYKAKPSAATRQKLVRTYKAATKSPAKGKK